MTKGYPKPWRSYQAQLDLLITRGMVVTDQAKALESLERIGYYRLSGYWFAFRERTGLCCPLTRQNGNPPAKTKPSRLPLDTFKPGTTFQNAVDLYVFDKKLRLLTMDALERIEIALRVDISHSLGKHEKFAYLRPDLFHESFSKHLESKTGLTKHHAWLSKHAALINRSNEDFIRHNKGKYGLPLAVWVACEVWDFGTLSTKNANGSSAKIPDNKKPLSSLSTEAHQPTGAVLRAIIKAEALPSTTDRHCTYSCGRNGSYLPAQQTG